MTIQERLDLFLSKEPQLAEEVFIARGATVIGDVRLGARSSVWYGCVLRGDINFIQIGEATNVQDGTVIHLADDFPVIQQADSTFRVIILIWNFNNQGMSTSIPFVWLASEGGFWSLLGHKQKWSESTAMR